MKRVMQVLAVASLVLCAGAAIHRFKGDLSDEVYKSWFLWGSIGWFVFETAAFSMGKKANEPRP